MDSRIDEILGAELVCWLIALSTISSNDDFRDSISVMDWAEFHWWLMRIGKAVTAVSLFRAPERCEPWRGAVRCKSLP